MDKRLAENIFLIAVIAIAVALFVGSLGVRIFASEPVNGRTYGCAIAVLLAVAALVQLLRNILGGSKKGEAGKVTVKEARKVLLVVALLAVFCFGIANVGFFTSTFVFAFLMLLLLSDDRSLPHIAINLVGSGAMCLALYGLFQAMKIYLPVTPLI